MFQINFLYTIYLMNLTNMQLQYSGFLNWQEPQQISKRHLGKADMEWMAEWELPLAAILIKDLVFDLTTLTCLSPVVRERQLWSKAPQTAGVNLGESLSPAGSMVPHWLWRSRIDPQSLRSPPKRTTLCGVLDMSLGQVTGPTAVMPKHAGVGKAAPWGEKMVVPGSYPTCQLLPTASTFFCHSLQGQISADAERGVLITQLSTLLWHWYCVASACVLGF